MFEPRGIGGVGETRNAERERRAWSGAARARLGLVSLKPMIVDDIKSFEPTAILTQKLQSMGRSVVEHLPVAAVALVALLATMLMAKAGRRLFVRLAEKANTRVALIRLGSNLIGILGWVLSGGVVLTILFPSVTPGQIIGGLGMTSVAIGFAFKDVFENFLAGVIILVRSKIRIGDVISCQDVRGSVEDISVRETHVRCLNGELAVLPNSFLFKNPLHIETEQRIVRMELVVGVDYDTDLELATKTLEDVLASCSKVDRVSPVAVQAFSFGASSIDFRLSWWTKSDPAERRACRHQVALATKAALDAKGIEIPFPQRVLSHRGGGTDNPMIPTNL